MNTWVSIIVNVLEDKSENLEELARFVLDNTGKRAATSEVIYKLVSAIEDGSEYIRGYARLALRKIGEKAGTNEVINILVSALEDQSEDVRRYACLALGNLGEKAATNEVINKLVSALEDKNESIRLSACRALGKIGEKAATNEVIGGLIAALERDRCRIAIDLTHAIGNILNSSSTITQLDPKIISNLCQGEREFECLKNISADQLIDRFFTTRNSDWLSVASKFTLLNRAAVVVIDDTVVVYTNKEPVELLLVDSKLREQLVDVFTNQAKGLHLWFEIASDAPRNESRVSPSQEKKSRLLHFVLLLGTFLCVFVLSGLFNVFR